MFPFINALNSQYLSDLYASSAYYAPNYYFIPEDNAPSWNHSNFQENSLLPISNAFPTDFQQEKQENSTKTSQRVGKTKERIDQESSVSAEALDESSQQSPEVRMRQKYGRNINSNIFHHMLKKMTSEEEYDKIMGKIITKIESSMSLPQFKQLLCKKVGRLPSYVSLTKMKKLFIGSFQKYRTTQSSQTRQREFCKIFRSVCNYYLKQVHILHIFNVLRIKNQSKHHHVMGCRKIAELMKQ